MDYKVDSRPSAVELVGSLRAILTQQLVREWGNGSGPAVLLSGMAVKERKRGNLARYVHVSVR